ncbi:YxeA family protein [Bacillus pseudomycoides]|uniref:YxeA family protein n=1 Tax=Bacillus bingmayongensis TaxID=1150157 RepID=A0ABU5K0F2_9BACI|nr:YxeA family protein [Bacillus pseudomycoides]
MKKLLVTLIAFLVLLGLLMTALVGSDWNLAEMKQKLGKDKMYVHIMENGKEYEVEKGNPAWKRYEYNVMAYDKDGNKTSIKFDANKNLKLNAFLRVYVFDEPNSEGYKGISTYEEVQRNEIPKKALIQMDKK